MESTDFYQVFSWGGVNATFDTEAKAQKYAEILKTQDDIDHVEVKPLQYMTIIPTARTFWSVYLWNKSKPEVYEEHLAFTDEDYEAYLAAGDRYRTREDAEAAIPALVVREAAEQAVRKWYHSECDKLTKERDAKIAALRS